MDYRRRITEVLLILVIIFSAFLFGPDLVSAYDRLASKIFFNPCKSPIEYSIGEVDSNFGQSADYFLSAAKDAEKMWESASGENLFEYKEGAKLKINFVYDYRQSATVNLNNLDNSIEKNDANYLQLKNNYDNYTAQYNANQTKINSLTLSYQKKKSNDVYNQITSLQQANNDLVPKINSLAEEINDMAKTVNTDINNYNDITQSVDKEFEQGNYVTDANKKEINIYQFEDRDKLIKVLAHEMGHALDIGHMDNPDDLMYALNAGDNQEITTEDLNALNAVCSSNPFGEAYKLFVH